MLKIDVWDAGEKVCDRYTVRIATSEGVNWYAMSCNPLSPQGFNQCIDSSKVEAGPRLGKRLKVWYDLSESVRIAIFHRI